MRVALDANRYADLARGVDETRDAQGTPIPTNDMWIASLVVEHSLALCTRDRHFANLPQLMIV